MKHTTQRIITQRNNILFYFYYINQHRGKAQLDAANVLEITNTAALPVVGSHTFHVSNDRFSIRGNERG